MNFGSKNRSQSPRISPRGGKRAFFRAPTKTNSGFLLAFLLLFFVGVQYFIMQYIRGKKVYEQPKFERSLSMLSEEAKLYLFDNYVTTFEKNYNISEYSHRFNVFKDNLALVDARNLQEKLSGGSAIHGITFFSDLTQREFEQTYLGTLTSSKFKIDVAVSRYIINQEEENALNSAVNWTNIYTTDIKYQGCCGDCWAVSAVEQIESDAIRLFNFNKSTPLSVQQITSCESMSAGCDGGWVGDAYEYARLNGLAYATEYPDMSSYSCQTESCMTNTPGSIVSISSYNFLNGDYPWLYYSAELQMANYVLTTGPMNVLVDSTSWSTYISGTMASCTRNINHGVQVVGLDQVNGYWIVSNTIYSWYI